MSDMGTLRVRFQGVGADVDERAKRGQEKQKERKLRRQRWKMALEEIFQNARAFLLCTTLPFPIRRVQAEVVVTELKWMLLLFSI
eukprot:scaffold9902_cov136-Amphora_coffeaeformis.AAC.1